MAGAEWVVLAGLTLTPTSALIVVVPVIDLADVRTCSLQRSRGRRLSRAQEAAQRARDVVRAAFDTAIPRDTGATDFCGFSSIARNRLPYSAS